MGKVFYLVENPRCGKISILLQCTQGCPVLSVASKEGALTSMASMLEHEEVFLSLILTELMFNQNVNIGGGKRKHIGTFQIFCHCLVVYVSCDACSFHIKNSMSFFYGIG